MGGQNIPSLVIWDYYFKQLQQWENENKDLSDVYDTLAMQIDMRVLPPPNIVDDMDIPVIPKRKLEIAMINHQKLVDIFTISAAETISSFIGLWYEKHTNIYILLSIKTKC